jgi:actin-like protein 6B
MLISGALTSLDADLRQQLLQNVVLTGGGSLFPGLGERLNDELVRHYPGVRREPPHGESSE